MVPLLGHVWDLGVFPREPCSSRDSAHPWLLGCGELEHLSAEALPPVYNDLKDRLTPRYAAHQTTWYGVKASEYGLSIIILRARLCARIPADITSSGRPGPGAGEDAAWLVVHVMEKNEGTQGLVEWEPAQLEVGAVKYTLSDAFDLPSESRFSAMFGGGINPGLKKNGEALYKVPQDLDLTTAKITLVAWDQKVTPPARPVTTH